MAEVTELISLSPRKPTMVVSDFIRMAQPTVTSEENTFQHKMKDLQQAPNKHVGGFPDGVF